MTQGEVVALRERLRRRLGEAQKDIRRAIEKLDSSSDLRVNRWSRPGGGGGLTCVFQKGKVFDKAGIGFSEIEGTLSPDGARAALGEPGPLDYSADAPFYATGLSVVIHPHNPLVAAVHANYRYFECCDPADDRPPAWWFGGVANLTPAYLFEDDVVHFHRVHKAVCDRYDESFYPRFKKQCDEYFYIPHRREHRGVGGIFFDGLNDRPLDILFAFVMECLDALLPAYLPIVESRKSSDFTSAQQSWQQIRRGRYVEFNLLYDRGTAFGLTSGANPESLLMPMPPVARWEYDYAPAPDSAEAKLTDVLKNPREWL